MLQRKKSFELCTELPGLDPQAAENEENEATADAVGGYPVGWSSISGRLIVNPSRCPPPVGFWLALRYIFVL